MRNKRGEFSRSQQGRALEAALTEVQTHNEPGSRFERGKKRGEKPCLNEQRGDRRRGHPEKTDSRGVRRTMGDRAMW